MARMSCICGEILTLPENQVDVKCAKCGRVFNHQGRYLWKEKPGNDLPGTSEIVTGPEAHGDRRAEDQDTALEEAFVAAKLPEVDRRTQAEKEADDAKAARGRTKSR
jgi:predicted  nucleic acid-binding Zn-ribbon protein